MRFSLRFNGCMWRARSWVPALGWCAATLASIGVATVALQPVLRTAAPGLDTPSFDRAPTVTASPPAGGVTASPQADGVTASPPANGSPSLSRPGPSAARPTATPGAVTVDGWTVTTGPDGQPTYLRSFRVGGGQAVIRMTAGRVQLVTATPNPGYSVDTVQHEPGNLAVQFTQPNHYFIIHAVWHNGPFAEVSEVGG